MTGAAVGAAVGATGAGATAGAGAARAEAPSVVWTGGFAEREVGIRLQNDTERSLVPLELLVGVALRRNPRRAQLLVSTVLAKHVPTDPGLVIVAAELLGLLVAGELDGRRPSSALFSRLTRILQPPAPAPATETAAADGGAAGGAAETREELAALRAEVAGLRSEHPEAVTIGYAETATGLGQLVAETIGAYYIHSTRHAPAAARPFAGFEEEHSHATSHQLYPRDPAWLRPGGTVVLVDDELSTGTTIVNTIRALHGAVPQARWVVASLIDLRAPDDRRRFDELAAALGTSIATVSLGAGSIALPLDVADRAARALALAAHPHPSPALAAHPAPAAGGRELRESAAVGAHSALPQAAVVPAQSAATAGGRQLRESAAMGAHSALPQAAVVPAQSAATAGGRKVLESRGIGAVGVLSGGEVTVVQVAGGAPLSARFGVDARPGSHAGAAAQIARAVAPLSPGSGEVLVLGSEEFIALPLAVADHLAGTSASALPATTGSASTSSPQGREAVRRVRFSTTTRSPISAIDRDDYAIASAITFQSHDLTHDGFGVRYAYNLTRERRRFDAIVFIPEPEADRDRMHAPDGVVEALRRVTDHVVVAHLTASPPTPATQRASSAATAPSAAAPPTAYAPVAGAPAAAGTLGTPTPIERRLP